MATNFDGRCFSVCSLPLCLPLPCSLHGNGAFFALTASGFAKGLYAGFGAVFLGTAPTHALMFGAYRESARELTPDSPHPYALSLLLTLTTASFGEAISLATYVPTEVVAKRMQVAAVGPGRHYRHAFHALSSISRVEGARGLYAGAAATALRDIPYTAVQLALYEAGKALVLGGGGYPTQRAVAAAAGAVVAPRISHTGRAVTGVAETASALGWLAAWAPSLAALPRR